jgi:hypothetical protein
LSTETPEGCPDCDVTSITSYEATSTCGWTSGDFSGTQTWGIDVSGAQIYVYEVTTDSWDVLWPICDGGRTIRVFDDMITIDCEIWSGEGTTGFTLTTSASFSWDEVEPIEIPAGDSCGEGLVMDCGLNCISESTAMAYTGDGYCDDGSYGLELYCEEFSFDGGDCD